jgi:hypothetical protein
MKGTKVHLILDLTWFSSFRAEIVGLVARLGLDVDYFAEDLFDYSVEIERSYGRVKSIGRATWRAISSVETDFFLIYGVQESIFHNHLRSLTNGIKAKSPFEGVSSGLLVESAGLQAERHLRLEFLAPPSADNYIYANGPIVKAQHMFRRSLIEKLNPSLFDILDGQEHIYLLHMAYFHGGITSSNTASMVYYDLDRYSDYPSIIPPEQQHQFIRDSGRAAAWALTLQKGQRLAEVIYAIPNGSPVPWADYLRRPGELNSLIRPGHRYEICQNGGGAKFLRHGFYGLEEHGVWIEGRSANLEFVIGAKPEEFASARRARVTLELDGRPARGTGLDQRAQVFCNGLPIATLTTPNNWASYVVDIDLAPIAEDASAHLRFVLEHAEDVIDDEGQVIDARQLGLRIRAISLELIGDDEPASTIDNVTPPSRDEEPPMSPEPEKPRRRISRLLRKVVDA